MVVGFCVGLTTVRVDHRAAAGRLSESTQDDVTRFDGRTGRAIMTGVLEIDCKHVSGARQAAPEYFLSRLTPQAKECWRSVVARRVSGGTGASLSRIHAVESTFTNERPVTKWCRVGAWFPRRFVRHSLGDGGSLGDGWVAMPRFSVAKRHVGERRPYTPLLLAEAPKDPCAHAQGYEIRSSH